MEDFRGKVAVVTGGASGVGRALGLRLAEAGARVALADIDRARVDEVADEIASAHGADVRGYVVDVTKMAEVQDFAAGVFADFGKVHLLFNNAGVGLGEAQRKLWDLPEADWHWGIDVNLMGVVHGIAAFVPRMLEAGEEGVIVNTSSGNGGLASMPNTPIYAASKAAVTSVTEVLYQQLLREGGKLRAAILFPGPHVINSSIMASKRNRPDSYGGADAQNVAYEKMEDLLRTTGLKMKLTEPDEVATFALAGIRKGNFWMIPDSEDADDRIRTRAEAMLTRGSPAPAW